MKPMKEIFYIERGLVERARRGSYYWTVGYSETSKNGKILYPWMNKRECQADARSRGCVARFKERGTK